MEDQEPTREQNEPTDWQEIILGHIITINHELGDVVRDVSWVKRLVKIILAVVILLALCQGEKVVDIARKALDLLV